jgi:cbb3-type cytochrome oxidase subunit 3
MQAYVYFIFGLSLVVLFGVIIAYYYTRHRHTHVEKAKYTMLDDDD